MVKKENLPERFIFAKSGLNCIHTRIFRSFLRMKINARRKHEKWAEWSGG
jgi:hypothetical protein